MVLARAVLLPQVVVAGVADVPVAQGEVPAPALDQAAVGAHGQDAARQALSRLIDPLAVSNPYSAHGAGERV